MKVKDLIKKLNTCDKNAMVIIEGCDCSAEAKGINKIHTENTVIITREDGVYSGSVT